MSQLLVNHRLMMVLMIFVLLFGILLQINFCKASGTRKKHRLKNILFLSAEEIPLNPAFPSDVVVQEENGTRLCFNIQAKQSISNCCCSEGFDCRTRIHGLSNSTYNLTVEESTLLKHDIVVLLKPMNNFPCMLSHLGNTTEFILNLHNCLKPGGRNIRMRLDYPCQNEDNNTQTCQGTIKYTFKFGSKITSCKKSSHEASNLAELLKPSNQESLLNFIKNISFYLDQTGQFTRSFKIGNVTGMITELLRPGQTQTTLSFGFTLSGEIKILTVNDTDMDIVLTLSISKETAVTKKDIPVAVLLFPGMAKSNRYFLNNAALWIKIAENISNLSKVIEIQYRNVRLGENSALCMSSDALDKTHLINAVEATLNPGSAETWTADFCKTNQTHGNVICRCSNHSLFAVVMTPFEPEKIIIEGLNITLGPTEAVNIMKHLGDYIKVMNNASTASIIKGNVTGVISKLPTKSADMNFAFRPDGKVKILGGNANEDIQASRSIKLPKKAIEMALNNGSHLGILRFPGMLMNNTDEFLCDNEILGIEIWVPENKIVKITGLEETIDIQYINSTMVETGQIGFEPQCVSWDGITKKGDDLNWTTDGCITVHKGNDIICKCSHLTFFALLKMELQSVDSSKPEKTIVFQPLDYPRKSEQAVNVMKTLGVILDLMGNSRTAKIQMGNITGVISRLSKQNQTFIDFGFDSNGDVMLLKNTHNVVTGIKHKIHFPKEASELAVERNGSFAGVFNFPEMDKLNKTSFFFKNEMLGMEMGAYISNLSETIDIYFSNVNTTEFNATCVSWDGKSKEGDKDKWITDGCLTIEVNGSITCQCSHLTFFAILMSSDKTVSSSNLNTLTQITKVGCGMSLFFLGVALFMHFLIRKTKASQALNILMNLFIALFVLNFCFLINESITNLKIFAACVVMGAMLHYSMLATFTWFFIQALHLYVNLSKIATDTKYYMHKICITGWVIPGIVVVGLLASGKYNYIGVSDDNGSAVNMCWIPDNTIHLGVNLGYYSIVYIFTLTIFIVTTVQICRFAPTEAKAQQSTKKKVFSLLALFCLLGLTWGFAFFSYGPLLLPSYYIFTILNSFQGFFLFVYYYVSSKIIPEERMQSKTSDLRTHNVSTSPYG